MKKLILLCVILLITACGGSGDGGGGDDGGGNGSDNIVYKEISVSDLSKIGNDPAFPLNENYRLINSGTLTGVWTPIGDNFNNYMGIFDGNGHTITIDQFNNTSQYNGLFGYIGFATIKNLTVTTNAQTLNYSAPDRGVSFGVIAGGASNSLISNVAVKGGKITLTANSNINYFTKVGGIIGLGSRTNIVFSRVEKDLEASDNGLHIGGFVGSGSQVIIHNSYHNANITGTSTNSAGRVVAGGFTGYSSKGEIHKSYNIGDVTAISIATSPGMAIAGGFSGWGDNSWALYSSALISGTVKAEYGALYDDYANSGLGANPSGTTKISSGNRRSSTDVTVTGLSTSGSAISSTLTDTQFRAESTYTDSPFSWDFTDTWEMGNPYPVLRPR